MAASLGQIRTVGYLPAELHFGKLTRKQDPASHISLHGGVSSRPFEHSIYGVVCRRAGSVLSEGPYGWLLVLEWPIEG